MKKIVIITLILVLMMSTGCSTNNIKENSTSSENSISTKREEISTQKDIGELLENTFITLWKSDTVYIDTEMIVEGKEKNDEKNTYHYIIAGDRKKQMAMLNMEEPDGTKVHYIIDKDKMYDINDEEKNYQSGEYQKTIDNFINAYTQDMNMGVSKSMKLSDSGTTTFNDKDNVEYEKYNISISNNTSEKITITYYYLKGKPYAEVMQSDRGKTTFLFKTVSNTVSDYEIFKVSPEYTNVT